MKFSASKRITFYRGDDDALLVSLANGGSFAVGDRAFFSLKAAENSAVDIFQIESTEFVEYEGVADGAILVTIPHENTIDLVLGKYYYDILIQWADGSFTTIIPPTRFVLEAGGSHDQP